MTHSIRRATTHAWIAYAVALACAAPARAQHPAAIATPEPAADYSREAYIVERVRTAWRFDEGGTGRKDVSTRVKVQTESSIRTWGQLVFSYNAANERMDVEFVRVLKADGTVVIASADAVQDLTSAVERIAPVYSDLREKHVTVPGLRPGDILEFAVATTMHTALAPGHFWTEHRFLDQGVVLDEQLEIDVPRDKPVTIKTRPGVEPSVTDRGNRRMYVWHADHRAVAHDDERLMRSQPAKVELPAVRLTTFQTWDAVGRWYATLERGPRTPTPQIRAKAAELTAGRATDLDRLQALYEYVAGNFRYVSLSFGIGRYQPHDASAILRNQYGDCKDKHTLLASLIESIGLHASAALVNSHADVDPDFPSPSQFDHVITRVSTGAGDVWLDTTTEVAPFRLLVPALRGKHALVIAPASVARLEDTPAQSPVVHSTDVQIDGTIDDAGLLSARVRFVATGDYELALRLVFRQLPSSEWKAAVAGMLSRGQLDGEMSEWHVSNPTALHDPFTIECRVAKTAFVAWTNRRADLRLPLQDFVSAPREDDESGAASIDLGSPHRSHYRLRLELPSAYHAQAPVSASIAREYADYRADYTIDAGGFTAERTLTLRDATLPSERRGDYAAFRNVVLRDLKQHLALESSASIASSQAPLKIEELETAGRDALDRGSYAQAVTLLTRVTDLDPKHKTVWSALGRAYLELGQTDPAIRMLRKQIEVNAFDLSAYNNLGLAYVQQRKFPEAEAAFQQQLALNPLDGDAHASLGGMYLEWRKFDAAAAALEKAIALSPTDAALRVRLGEAYLNLQQHDKAMATFDRAAELDAGPRTWNEIAYRLALKKTDLALALRYAESAVASTVVASRNLSVEHVTARGLWEVGQLGAYWDTLGWVYFAKGDLGAAERFVRAAWALTQNAEVGDHLAQIYEQQGRRDDAVRMYGLALNAERPDAGVRERLAALVGDGRHVDAVIDRYRGELIRARTVNIDVKAPAGSTADFFVLFDRASVVSVRFIEGDDRLSPLSDALRTAKYDMAFPDEGTARLLRRGTLSCAAREGRHTCQFVMALPYDAQLMEQR
jgi:tetratricopeptide (TPR) repeat protein